MARLLASLLEGPPGLPPGFLDRLLCLLLGALHGGPAVFDLGFRSGHHLHLQSSLHSFSVVGLLLPGASAAKRPPGATNDGLTCWRRTRTCVAPRRASLPCAARWGD